MPLIKIGNFEFKKLQQAFKGKKATLPGLIAKDAKNHFILGFRKSGGQTDASLSGWTPRRRAEKSTKRRGILVKSGDLRRSIKITSKTFNLIRIASEGLKYAAIHNFGLTGFAFGKHPFKMPKREFIGDSRVLVEKIRRKITTTINRIFPR